jgi:hypothetical protein
MQGIGLCGTINESDQPTQLAYFSYLVTPYNEWDYQVAEH